MVLSNVGFAGLLMVLSKYSLFSYRDAHLVGLLHVAAAGNDEYVVEQGMGLSVLPANGRRKDLSDGGFHLSFRERKEFMKEWVCKNNEQFGYPRFSFLYLEDTLSSEQRREKTLQAIKDFFIF